MRQRIVVLLLAAAFVAACLGGTGAAGPVQGAFGAEGTATARAATKQRDSRWRKNPAGSAGVLEGQPVIISIFINDKDSRWTNKAKREANRKLAAASKYISGQAKKYGKKAEIVTDIYKNNRICYSYTTKMKLNDSAKKQDRLYENVEKFIDSRIDLTKIRQQYGTDSIGFLFHINKSGVSSTLVHYIEEGEENFYECSTVFSQCGGKAEGASTYAHEMLHLFGARDLYERSLPDGITASFVRHIEKKFPNDIMFSTYTKRGKQLKYSIKNEISRVTAYFLGWKNKIPEQKKYALPGVEQKGCFSDGTSWRGR